MADLCSKMTTGSPTAPDPDLPVDLETASFYVELNDGHEKKEKEVIVEKKKAWLINRAMDGLALINMVIFTGMFVLMSKLTLVWWDKLLSAVVLISVLIIGFWMIDKLRENLMKAFATKRSAGTSGGDDLSTKLLASSSSSSEKPME